MTQDEIIEMSKEASLTVTYIGDPIGLSYAQIAHFAKLVAAKEREACAKAVENSLVKQNVKYSLNNINEKDVEKIYKLQCELGAKAIRARGEA